MSAKQQRLFEMPGKPRQAPRKLARVIDAGEDSSGMPIAVFQCGRCDWKSDWLPLHQAEDPRRGIPCPQCNAKRILREYVVMLFGGERRAVWAETMNEARAMVWQESGGQVMRHTQATGRTKEVKAAKKR